VVNKNRIMPDFSCDEISIEPYEYVRACRSSEIRELIIELVDEEHLPKSVLKLIDLGDDGTTKTTYLENEFIEKINLLSQKYHSLTKEDEEFLEMIFKKYI
jgi:hypothetical protein